MQECVEGKGAMWGPYREEACRGDGVQGVQRECVVESCVLYKRGKMSIYE